MDSGSAINNFLLLIAKVLGTGSSVTYPPPA